MPPVKGGIVIRPSTVNMMLLLYWSIDQYDNTKGEVLWIEKSGKSVQGEILNITLIQLVNNTTSK